MVNAIEIKGLVKEYPGFRLDGLDPVSYTPLCRGA